MTTIRRVLDTMSSHNLAEALIKFEQVQTAKRALATRLGPFASKSAWRTLCDDLASADFVLTHEAYESNCDRPESAKLNRRNRRGSYRGRC